jgi:hypothetical protein
MGNVVQSPSLMQPAGHMQHAEVEASTVSNYAMSLLLLHEPKLTGLHGSRSGSHFY